MAGHLKFVVLMQQGGAVVVVPGLPDDHDPTSPSYVYLGKDDLFRPTKEELFLQVGDKVVLDVVSTV